MGTTAASAVDTTLLREYLRLRDEVEATDERLSALKERRDRVEEELLKAYERNGTSSVRCDGRTVYLHRQLWARPKDGDHALVCDLLRAHDLGDLVRTSVNAQTLSSLVRERDAEGTPLPEDLAAAIDVSEAYRLRVRKAR